MPIWGWMYTRTLFTVCSLVFKLSWWYCYPHPACWKWSWDFTRVCLLSTFQMALRTWGYFLNILYITKLIHLLEQVCFYLLLGDKVGIIVTMSLWKGLNELSSLWCMTCKHWHLPMGVVISDGMLWLCSLLPCYLLPSRPFTGPLCGSTPLCKHWD